MNEIPGKIYNWFGPLFGQYLGEHLWGYNCTTQVYDDKNYFNQIGLIALGISFASVLLYYYVINHTRFSQWRHWLMVLLISGIINLFIGYGITVNHFLNGTIDDCLMFVRDGQGNIISQLIYRSDCWYFGLANFFVSSLFFIGFSFMLKWWSRNCKHSPVKLKTKN